MLVSRGSVPTPLAWVLVIACLVRVSGPPPCLAQAVSGTVRDTTTNQTIAYARVTLLDELGDTAVAVRSDNHREAT